MLTHLTVISYTHDFQTLFEDIDDALLTGNAFHTGDETQDEHPKRRRPVSHAKIERCQKWKNLPNLALNVGRPIDLLDLVGHGSSEDFELGDGPFLLSHVEPPEVIDVMKRVKPHLADKARVRLLGCETAVGESGLRMLKNLSRALEREVLGTTVELLSTDFGPYGLSEEFASAYLYSSHQDQPTEALSRDAFAKFMRQLPHPWEQRLPGYQLIGRGEPFFAAAFSLRVQGSTVSVASDRRLVLVRDQREGPPLMLRWSKLEPAPSMEKLLPSLR
ncbi:DUF4347 domain-containing protein [Corallococcus aberystwythensis]|uniref:DUF4347 domain-containing protein n=1 Tax=Corallococcus aberystwythensis TaxID=2316722 RepID=A0A3A8PS55_9BACT|nr:DUF4347 domain-containing protein [Corallococcus aberystwythensis]RKH59223.1 DUF4347 domain-containing protein [Corallococcus aberystwythensis]